MKMRRGQAARGLSRKSRKLKQTSVERFEDRLLMTVYTVINTQDNPTTGSPGDGTLRGEIQQSNANPPTGNTINQIVFGFTTTGVQTINLNALLPPVTVPLLIDGSSSNGFSGTPLVQINGASSMVGGGPGLSINAPTSEVRDLIISNFKGDGIDLNGGGGLVDGNWIGLNSTGAAAAGNTGQGVYVSSANNTIGGLSSGPNVISGNVTGIQIQGGVATGNFVTHNYVGTDVTGLLKVGNSNYGIEVDSGRNTIGGVSFNGPGGSGNLVSGNTNGGINLSQQASNILVEGNYVGVDKTGLNPLPNSSFGVYLNSVQNDTIGGSFTGTGNVISGNSSYGVQVTGATTSNIQIQGNDIGVGSNGTKPIGNLQTGVFILSGKNVTVGGTTILGNAPQFGNIIAYNGLPSNQYGVEVMNSAMDGILSNSIYSNGNLGIKLNQANAGVSPPNILSAISGAGQTRISGTYFGSPGTPYRIQFFSNQIANPSGSGDGQNYLSDLDFTTDNTGQFNFTTVLQVGVPVGDVISATATLGPLQVNDTSQFSVDVPVTMAAITDLSVTTGLPTVGPLLSQPYTYALTVTNIRSNDATGVLLTDQIPANSTFVSSTAGTFANGTFTDAIGNLATGASVTVDVVVKPISTGRFVNTATVTGNELDPDLTNNVSTTTGTVLADSDLSVFLTPSANPTPVGSPVTFTLVIGNNGPSTANGTVATVQFPGNFTNIVVSPDQGSFTVDQNNLVTINTGILPGSSSSTVIITATPTPPTIGLENVTATVSSSEADPNPANNTVTVPITVANAADLAVSISAQPASGPGVALVGQELIYTVTVTNNGPSSATSPVALDALPSNVTYNPVGSSAGQYGTLTEANGVVTANLFALLPMGTATFTIGVTPNVSAQVVNTVSVGDPTLANSVEIDPTPENNTATISTVVSPADLQVVIDEPSSSSPLFIGTPVTYQVTVTNNGPATATNVLLNDSFNPGATIISTSAGQASGSVLNANLGTLASGASVTVTIVADPTLAGYSGNLINSAAVSSDEIDPDTNNNTASTANLVSPVDVGVLVVASPSSILVGHSLLYVVAVTNYGPATATNVNFLDTLPNGVTFNSVSSSQATISLVGTNTLTGVFPSLAPDATAIVTIQVTPNLVQNETDTATATPFELDTNPANNTSSATATVINLPGTIQLATPSAIVAENGGSVTLTLNRVGGTSGAVSINYTTANGTAVAGVNYVPISGTLTFLDGQSTATITIPILDDQVVNGDNQFLFLLSSPTNGATLGSPSFATIDVTNVDRDTTPPVVTSLTTIPNHSSLNGFILTFSKSLDLGRASDVSNYHVFIINGAGKQLPINLAAAVYDDSTHTVKLVPTAVLPGNRFYRIVVNGSVGNVLTDTSGNILAGSSGPHSNYDVTIGTGTSLVYTDAGNNSVSLKLSGGGTLAVYLAANGNASEVDLIGIVPHKSKLTGSVKKLKKSSSGHTTIGEITGFGQFGNVFSTLKTPAFYVNSAVVTAASYLGSTTVSIESVPSSNVSVTTKTPKGPQVRLN